MKIKTRGGGGVDLENYLANCALDLRKHPYIKVITKQNFAETEEITVTETGCA